MKYINELYYRFYEEDGFYDGVMKNTKIIVDECCLKHSLNKKQKDLFEKILYELSEYHKCECLQLIKFVLKDIKKDNKLKNISRKFHNKSHFIRKNF